MAKEILLKHGSNSFSASITKVDREKVYGWVETVYVDAQNRKCKNYTMLDDGKTIIGSGGIAMKTLDLSHEEVDKSTIKAIYVVDGKEATLIPSVFDSEIILDTSKTVYDYLQMDVKSVYQLTISDGLDDLLTLLQKNIVAYFKFNYRAGYDSDDAFILSQHNHIFIVVGSIKDFQYITEETVVELEDTTEETEEIDFNML